VNGEENFYVWVNEEDHLSVIVQSRHSQIRETYGRLQRAMEKLNQLFDFQQHPRLGYLNFSPLNIGTALQIDVQLRFSHLEKLDAATDFCRKRDIRLETTNDEKNVVHLSNRIRLGRTEFHLVRGMIDAVEQLLEMSEREKQER
jgi:protein-arginine kinase